MSNEQKYFDTDYCGHCDKDTEQLFYCSGHERDSSNDWVECMECGYMKIGGSNQWTAPHHDDPDDMDWDEEDSDEDFEP